MVDFIRIILGLIGFLLIVFSGWYAYQALDFVLTFIMAQPL